MALEVLHQQAATHENEQFRRVVKIMDAVFKKHGYNGILVGNPFNENYRRFRADAILFYDNGVVIIDFKDPDNVRQGEPHLFQGGDPSHGQKLIFSIIPVTGKMIDFRRLQQSDIIIVTEHSDAYSGQF